LQYKEYAHLFTKKRPSNIIWRKHSKPLNATHLNKHFEAKNGEADYVVMAIENSIAGSILPNYTLLLRLQFPVVGEIYLPIQLHLMACRV
jgi:prephenate dehydratase